MSLSSTRSSLDIFRVLLIAVLAGIAIAIVVLTVHWPLVWDAQVFHYNHFLVDNGFAPYRDIPDINMPGVYVLEGWAIRLFGAGDIGWRIYDFVLLAALTLAMIVVSRPYDWLAGLFAGIAFALLHANDGPWNSVERDEIMTVFILVGYAFLFESLRRRRPGLMLGFGLAFGMATTLKPTAAPLGLVLLIVTAWRVKKDGRSMASSVWFSVAGAALAALLPLIFLLQHHALHACVQNIERYTPFYAGLGHADLGALLRFMPKKIEVAMLPFALLVAVRQKRWDKWERFALLLGLLFSALSYIEQAKGYDYHRYPMAALVLLWMSIELALAMREQGWRRWVGAAGFVAGILVGAPLYLQHAASLRANSDFIPIEKDLAALGVDRLQHQVQCMDVVQGCYTALYHLKLVQSSGMVGDILLFNTTKSPAVDDFRNWYWKQLTSNPPAAIVVTNEWFGHRPSFQKLDQWPIFAQYLGDNYDLVIARNLTGDNTQRVQESAHAYRIYIRKGASLAKSGT